MAPVSAPDVGVSPSGMCAINEATSPAAAPGSGATSTAGAAYEALVQLSRPSQYPLSGAQLPPTSPQNPPIGWHRLLTSVHPPTSSHVSPRWQSAFVLHERPPFTH